MKINVLVFMRFIKRVFFRGPLIMSTVVTNPRNLAGMNTFLHTVLALPLSSFLSGLLLSIFILFPSLTKLKYSRTKDFYFYSFLLLLL